jgi:hypothetical protein
MIGDTHADIRIWGEFMKDAFEMGSAAMICIPSFIKIGSATQKLIIG